MARLVKVKVVAILRKDFSSYEEYHDAIYKLLINDWESLIEVTSGFPLNSYAVLELRVYEEVRNDA